MNILAFKRPRCFKLSYNCKNICTYIFFYSDLSCAYSFLKYDLDIIHKSCHTFPHWEKKCWPIKIFELVASENYSGLFCQMLNIVSGYPDFHSFPWSSSDFCGRHMCWELSCILECFPIDCSVQVWISVVS